MNKKKSVAITAAMVVALVLVMIYSLPAAGQIPQIYTYAVSDKGVDNISNLTVRNPLLSTILSQPFDQTQQVYIGPQIAMGGGYSSTMTVRNVDGLDIAWEADFYDPSGKSLNVWPHFLSNESDPPHPPYKVIGGGGSGMFGWVWEMTAPSLTTGYVKLVVNGSIPVTGLKYTLKDSSGGFLSTIDVQVVVPAPIWNMLLRYSKVENPGIAVVNPNPTPVTVKYEAFSDFYQHGHVPYATVTKDFNPNQQITSFFGELFADAKLPLDDGGGCTITSGNLRITTLDGSDIAVSGVQFVSTNTAGQIYMSGVPVAAGIIK